jgi:hypothetical protein
MSDMTLSVRHRDGGDSEQIELTKGYSAGDIEEMALSQLGLEENDGVFLVYTIEEINGEGYESEADPSTIAELLCHDNGPVTAALEEYHRDPKQALILLRCGYTVWKDFGELVDNYLEDYDLPYEIMQSIDAEKLEKYIRKYRTFVESPSTGELVEFHR